MMQHSQPIALNHPCVACSRRKVKCDRKSPCTRCLTTGRDCEQPEVRRTPRRPRKPQDGTVLDRVRQLENTLEEMKALLGHGDISNSDPPERAETQDPQADTEVERPRSLDESLERLVVEDEKTRFIGSTSWANITDQVCDLRTLLEDDTPEDEYLVTKGSLSSYLAETLLPQQFFINEHPCSLIGFPYLWETYVTYVDPTMKVIHVPSMQIVIDKALSSPLQITKSTHCLISAIKFAAVTSLQEEDCQNVFNTSRQVLLNIHRSEVQFALKNAGFLVSQDLAPLQAFIIFLFCNRRHEQPRAMWTACGIAIRIAESIGLHRDGTLMKLPVLATEIRRRVYWELRVLDSACAEDSGFMPTLIHDAVTQIPLNINDSDIGPADETFPVEREGATDMVLPLLRYAVTKRTERFYTQEATQPVSGEEQGTLDRLQRLQKHQTMIETKYFRHLKLGNPVHRLAFLLGQYMLKKQTLLARYPLFHQHSVPVPEHLHDILFDTSCDILESGDKITGDPELRPWSWMFQTFVPWHPVVYLLNELSKNPGNPERERAWRAVDLALAVERGLTPEANRALWRPLQGLIEKARTATIQAGGTAPLFFTSDCSVQEPPAYSTAGDYGNLMGDQGFLMDHSMMPALDYGGPGQNFSTTISDFGTENTGASFGGGFSWSTCAGLGNCYNSHTFS